MLHRSRWRGTAAASGVVLFYGHTEAAQQPWFSNFYQHPPIRFVIPEWCGVHGGKETVVSFSEKSLMLCKASLMGDTDTFHAIEVSDTPDKVKRLGRQVRPWDEERWQAHVCDIATHVISTKFASLPRSFASFLPALSRLHIFSLARMTLLFCARCRLQHYLLATGERAIAEAAPHDRVWGIGLDASNPDAQQPHMWRGANVLGWALMKVRAELRCSAAPAQAAAPATVFSAPEEDRRKMRAKRFAQATGSACDAPLPFPLNADGSSAFHTAQLSGMRSRHAQETCAGAAVERRRKGGSKHDGQ